MRRFDTHNLRLCQAVNSLPSLDWDGMPHPVFRIPSLSVEANPYRGRELFRITTAKIREGPVLEIDQLTRTK